MAADGLRNGLSVPAGAALYVGAVLGPGLLLLPGLAVATAGPASVLAWAGLLVLSAPLTATFAALGTKHPVAGGTAAYVAVAFGPRWAAATGWCFVAGVMVGAPTVSLIGGQYVAVLLGGGRPVALLAAALMFAAVLGLNAAGLRTSTRAQLVAVAVLSVLVLLAVTTALPHARPGAWTPFAPHGWLAVGSAANLLALSFVGWEAVTHLVGDFPDPARQLPRAMAAALALITVLYLGLAVTTVVALDPRNTSLVPLADLMQVGLGRAGRQGTAGLAVLLTLGTTNAYIAGAATLSTALSRDGAAPSWIAAGQAHGPPRRGLLLIAAVGTGALLALALDLTSVEGLIRSASTLFVAVYAAGTAAGMRLLTGLARVAAVLAFGLVLLILSFSGRYLLIVVVVSVAATVYLGHRRSRTRPVVGRRGP